MSAVDPGLVLSSSKVPRAIIAGLHVEHVKDARRGRPGDATAALGSRATAAEKKGSHVAASKGTREEGSRTDGKASVINEWQVGLYVGV
jgi:hypothetical protein